MTVDNHSAVVVKVGGSLHDLPRLGEHLRRWLEPLPTRHLLFVAGGGPAADWVRAVDHLDHLGEEQAHWLALHALSLTARTLAARLGNAIVIDDIGDRQKAWLDGQWPVLDPYRFARTDEGKPDHLPHCWDVTSDSLAARAALVAGMDALVLLKSASLPPGCDWTEATRLGVVDAIFPQVMAAANRKLRVTVVNFRQWCLPASSAVTPPGNRP